MKILVDMSSITKNTMLMSIPLYTFRFVRSIPEELQDNFVLLVNQEIADNVNEEFPSFTKEYWEPNFLLRRIPVVRKIYEKMLYKKIVDREIYDAVFVTSDIIHYTKVSLIK